MAQIPEYNLIYTAGSKIREPRNGEVVRATNRWKSVPYLGLKEKGRSHYDQGPMGAQVTTRSCVAG